MQRASVAAAVALLSMQGCRASSSSAPTGAPEHAQGHPGAQGHEHAQGHPGAQGHEHAQGHSGAQGHEHAAHGEPHGAAHDGGHAHRHDFHDAERFAKLFDDPARDAWQKPSEVVALTDLRPGMTVADIGAGTGYFVPHLVRAVTPGGQVLALDVEPAMVKYMEERITREKLEDVSARLVPTGDPELAAASVDRILIVDTWHHIEDRVPYAQKLRSALRPGGRVVVVDFTLDSPHGPPPPMRLAADVVQRELTAAGFTVELAREELPYQYVVIARVP